MGADEYSKGLEGVIASESAISRIDGESGRLSYRGYDIEDLAQGASFEEVVYLLLHDDLPDTSQHSEFSGKMRSSRDLSQPILSMISEFPPTAHPMELLQSVVSYLSGWVEHKIHHSPTCNCRHTLHQVAQLASVVATFARRCLDRPYVAPRHDLSHGANFLYMLRGEPPSALEGEIMDRALVLHAEHELNASTFTARVVASTMSTCYCSISSAMGALYGSLHGGANEKVLAMVDEIGDPGKVEPWIDHALASRKKVMGMGHRVYKAKDPRARIIEKNLEELADAKNDRRDVDILKEIERVFGDRMAGKGKALYPNVDFFSGAVYRLMGIKPINFTPIFAMARAAGWLAHILEQRANNRILRPTTRYVGPGPRPFVPRKERK